MGKGVRIPLKNYKAIDFLSNALNLDPLENHKTTQPALNVGTSSALQRNAFLILMAFSWRADDDLILVVQ